MSRPTIVAVVLHARTVPSLAREAFAEAVASLPVDERVIVVHTCHRVELYVAPGAAGMPALPPLPAGAVRLTDVEAVRHLISVACGLDSVVFGEDQILHQVRTCLAERHADAPLDPVLDRLFQAALRAGRRAHTWFDGSPRSLADVALDRIARTAGPLAGRTVLVAGVGRMGRLAAFAAHRRGAGSSSRTAPTSGPPRWPPRSAGTPSRSPQMASCPRSTARSSPSPGRGGRAPSMPPRWRTRRPRSSTSRRRHRSRRRSRPRSGRASRRSTT